MEGVDGMMGGWGNGNRLECYLGGLEFDPLDAVNGHLLSPNLTVVGEPMNKLNSCIIHCYLLHCLCF